MFLNVLSRRRAKNELTNGFQRQKSIRVDTLCSGVTCHLNIVILQTSVMTQVNKAAQSVLLLHTTAQSVLLLHTTAQSVLLLHTTAQSVLLLHTTAQKY